MTYVIAAPCIADYSCVEICPVDCISPGPDDCDFENAEQMYIDPQRCIDCGACQQVCPVLAIYEAGDLPAKWSHYADVNADFFLARST
jgi:formate hydrogenlyase subunit 6/NADH:ubiquinone oxidoreductase subunit I